MARLYRRPGEQPILLRDRHMPVSFGLDRHAAAPDVMNEYRIRIPGRVAAQPAWTILVALVILAPRDASAQMFVTTGRDTLRSLPGIEVVVESLPAELERAGLRTIDVRADVDRRLRAKGVPIFSSQGTNPS